MTKTEKTSFSINKLFLLLGIVVFAAGFVAGKGFFNKSVDTDKLKTKTIPDAIARIVPSDIKFDIGDLKEQNGVYKFELVLSKEGQQPIKQIAYISKDGKIIFQNGIEIDSLLESKESDQAEGATSCEDISKSKTPKLTAYIVSRCPYGIQMQRVFSLAINELPQLASYLDVKYIGTVTDGKVTSMHGEEEAEENLRQICLREEQKSKYWDYVSCYIKEGKSKDCLSSSNIDKGKLEICINDKSKGLNYAKQDFELSDKLQIQGSPSLILNDSERILESGFGGRIPDMAREIICCSSQKKPEFCDKEISKNAVAASFSPKTNSSGGDVAGACN